MKTPYPLNSQDLNAVREEILASYTREEVRALKSFNEFFDLEDVRQAYEFNDWENEKEYWRLYIRYVFEEIRAIAK